MAKTRNNFLIGRILWVFLFSSLEMSLSTEKESDIKLKTYGIPPLLTTGHNLLLSPPAEDNFSKEETSDSLSKESSLGEGGLYKKAWSKLHKEFFEKYERLYEATRENLNNQTFQGLEGRLLTSPIVRYVPAFIIQKQALNLQDSYWERALKLVRLGLDIKDLDPELLPPHAQPYRRIMSAHCYALAGYSIERYLETFRIPEALAMGLDALKDIYLTGGIFYYWAYRNLPGPGQELMARRSQELYESAELLKELF